MEKLLNFIQLVLAISGFIGTITLSIIYFEQTLLYIIISATMNFLVVAAVCISLKELINKD